MILIGNIISFAASIFMMLSCVVKDRKKIFHLQFLQCALLAVSSWFFVSYSGIVANAVAAMRNLTVAQNKFTKKMALLFLVLSVVFGLLFNNRGFIGLLPMIANVQFAVCCYLFTGIKGTKISIWFNVLLWILYSFLIMDFSTALSDTIVLIINTATIINLCKDEKAHTSKLC